MNRLTKMYENGRVTIDGARFGIDQAALDSEVASNKAIAAAVKRLAELEDKQEPKKPVNLLKMSYLPGCPNCEKYVSSGSNYCPNCGQALDWSECDG